VLSTPRGDHDDRTTGSNRSRSGARRLSTGSVSERSQPRLLALEGEEQKVDQRKVALSGPSVGRQLGSVKIDVWLPSIARWNVSATTHARPNPLQPAGVQLGLTQDVEPQRGVLEQRVALQLGQPAQGGRRCFGRGSGRW